jgi:hypothetical protein
MAHAGVMRRCGISESTQSNQKSQSQNNTHRNSSDGPNTF